MSQASDVLIASYFAALCAINLRTFRTRFRRDAIDFKRCFSPTDDIKIVSDVDLVTLLTKSLPPQTSTTSSDKTTIQIRTCDISIDDV